jgi:tRNA-2-methylthio-N6-dimethylallyladenosine synthase
MRDDKHLINLDFSFDKKFDLLPGEHSPQGYSAFLSIQEGCDKFCSFCVVPYTRGAEFSRGFSEIYREALQYSSSGTVELTLLGQNVNAYHGLGADGQNCNLSYLIEQLSNIEQIKRLRYTTSHPRDMTPDLIEAHGNFPKLMPCLHLPVQSGSDKVLKEMNRKHTVEEYLAIIAGLRESRPDITFTSDFIVGFPGESEQDFQDTLDLIREVNFTQAFSFKYSPRPGTPASVKKNQIDVDVQDERLARLQALVTGQQMKFNQGFVGQYVEVLFERAGKFAGQVIGKTPYMQSVYIENGKDYLGQILPVRITGYKQNSLIGEVA